MQHRTKGSAAADPLDVVQAAHASTLAAATARYSWRTPVEGPPQTSAHGHTDLTTGAATMTTTTTGPPSPGPPVDAGVLVLDGLVDLPGDGVPPATTAHALLVPEAETLSMVLLDEEPTQDPEGRWSNPRADTPSLTMEVDPLLGSVGATFHWLAAVTSAHPAGTPGSYRVAMDLSKLVDDALPHRREAVRLTLDRLHPGLSTGVSAANVGGTVQIDPTTGFVTSFSVAADEPGEGLWIDPVLLHLRDHGVAVAFAAPTGRG